MQTFTRLIGNEYKQTKQLLTENDNDSSDSDENQNKAMFDTLSKDELLSGFIARNEYNNKFVFYYFNDGIDFIEFYENLDNKEKCFHEIMISNKFRKLYFDIDAKPNDKVTFNEMVNFIVYLKTVIISVFNKLYFINQGMEISDKNILICQSIDNSIKIDGDSKLSIKFSVHIIITGFMVKDYTECRFFAQKVIDDIYITKYNKFIEFIDTNVYAPNKSLRILDSYKPKLENITSELELRRKKLAKSSRHFKLSDSLLTYFNGEIILNKLSDEQLIEEKYKNASNNVNTLNSDEFEDYINILIKNHEEKLSYFNIRETKINDNICTIEFDRLQPSYCDVCNEVHHNDNSLLIKIYINDKFISIREFCRQNFGKYITNHRQHYVQQFLLPQYQH